MAIMLKLSLRITDTTYRKDIKKMSSAKEYIDDFKANYEQFMLSCDAVEEEGKWPKDELGEMNAYFMNDFACVIIRLVAADGKIDEEELAFLNDALGFDYKAEELEELYKNDGDRIDAYFETELDDSLAMIKGINEKLAESFKNLLVMVGKIVVESDGVVTEEEKGAAQKLIEALDK